MEGNQFEAQLNIPRWRRLWLWQRKWMIGTWLGLPLVLGTVFTGNARSEFAGISVAAQTAPRFVKEGIITRPDPRGRNLLLTTEDGKKRRIFCSIEPTQGSSCLFDHTIDIEFPLRARIKLFAFKGFWMILSVTDNNGTRSLTSIEKQVSAFTYHDVRYKNATTFTTFVWGFFLAYFTIVPIFGIPELIRRFRKRRRERQVTDGK